MNVTRSILHADVAARLAFEQDDLVRLGRPTRLERAVRLLVECTSVAVAT
jgi:hypothetical protein